MGTPFAGMTRLARTLPLLLAATVAATALSLATRAAAATPNTASAVGRCLPLPADFSRPRVKGGKAPPMLWNGWTYGHSIALTVTPAAALVDAPVTIRVTGLEPREPVTLRTSVADHSHHAWQAHATFIADDHGNVDVARQAPAYGSYSGVHAMGLIWSLAPVGVSQPSSTYFAPPGNRYTIGIEAVANGHVLARAALTRTFLAPGVRETEVNNDGLVSDFFRPAGPGPHPAVLVLGGSDGGMRPHVAALLAAHGYAALALAYFSPGGDHDPRFAELPKVLADIPLEYFAKAARWLRRQPGVDAHRVAIMGWSKGAEAALISAATFPQDFQAAVAYVPSSVVWFALQFTAPATSSWSLGGKPLPWVNPGRAPQAFAPGKPISFEPLYAAGLENAAEARQATIPVERIAGPVLLISAGGDRMWPSSAMAREIMQRLAEHHHRFHDESICYAAAGHAIGVPFRPTNASAFAFGTRSVTLGGNPVAYAYANESSWPAVLAFLHRALH